MDVGVFTGSVPGRIVGWGLVFLVFAISSPRLVDLGSRVRNKSPAVGVYRDKGGLHFLKHRLDVAVLGRRGEGVSNWRCVYRNIVPKLMGSHLLVACISWRRGIQKVGVACRTLRYCWESRHGVPCLLLGSVSVMIMEVDPLSIEVVGQPCTNYALVVVPLVCLFGLFGLLISVLHIVIQHECQI